MSYVEDVINGFDQMPKLFVYTLILIAACKFVWELLAWVVDKFGIETRSTRRAKQLEQILTNYDGKITSFEANFKALYDANRVSLGGQISQKYREYIKKGHIPLDEFDEFVDLHKIYKSLGGNHSGDLKFNKCMELPIVDEDAMHVEEKVSE